MKTVCKKLLCLMLVAMMLVSAVPFAFASETALFWVEIRVDGVGQTSKQLTLPVNPDEDTIVAYAKADAEYSAFFATYASYEVVEKAETSAAINFKGAPAPDVEPAPVCEHTDVTVTDTATCNAAGVKTTVCKTCGETVKTEETGATGHNFVGAECTKCDATREAYKTIRFHYLDVNGDKVYVDKEVYASGEHVTPPSVPVNPTSGFSYWKQFANDTGMKINKDEVLVVNSETPTEFHAIYNEKSAMSELKIYVVRYVNGVRKEANYLFSEYFTTGNTNNMYQYLWNNDDAIVTAAINQIGAGYTWNEKFYNYFTDEELTNSNMKDNGNKSVYIKMNTKNTNEAQVLLYIHKGKTSTVHDILEMDGYNAGETVYLNNVKDFLKDEGYKWSSISSLYTDEEYDDLLDGETPSGSNSIKINDNGTYKIHVILNGSSQSNNADSSNPKTGDSIMVAVTTMTLAAAALVAVVELKKRKMI